MFCENCGAKIQEGGTFCAECGAPIRNVQPETPTTGTVQTKRQLSKRARIIAISAAAIVVVAVLVIVLVSIFGGRGYKSTAEKFVEATFSADGKTMVSLIPDKVLKLACEEADMTKKEFTEYLTENLEDSIAYYDRYFDKWSYSYDIAEIEDYSSKALKSLKEDYEDEYDIDVKAAKTITVDITIRADGEKDEESLDIVVIKIGNTWYIDVLSTF